VTVLSTQAPAAGPAISATGPAPSSDARRTELAAYLRACRSRITPEAVGLAPGPRRRTPGLRREEVAQLAGVGITWYTWLEQGRRINASEQVIEAIARSLRLDAAEREHLFRLAEVTPTRGSSHQCVPAEVQTIIEALDPLPASVSSARYDILAGNAAYRALFPNVMNQAGRQPNSMWCAFVTPDCCNPFINRDVELPRMVALLRAGYGRHVGEPEWESFLADLRAASPWFSELWARQQVAAPGRMEKIFRHAAVGEIRMTTTSLYVVQAPETRIVVYTPQDDETRDRIAWLRANPEVSYTDHVH
jgi:transcriptional regulator with XRE-family HTH domain